MVFSDHLELGVVGYPDIGGDVFELAFLSFGPDLIPVGLPRRLDWLSAELPRAFDPGVLLEAVHRCSVVHLNWSVCGILAVLNEC